MLLCSAEKHTTHVPEIKKNRNFFFLLIMIYNTGSLNIMKELNKNNIIFNRVDSKGVKGKIDIVIARCNAMQ